MGIYDFTRRECVKVLVKLGFELKNDRRGIHDKYAFPEEYPVPEGHRPFIMIPRHSELKIQHKILKELEQIGGKELLEKFLSFI